MNNQAIFTDTLRQHLTPLMQTPIYAMAAKKYTPHQLAVIITGRLLDGTAEKSGLAVQLTCRELGISATYIGITKYIKDPQGYTQVLR